MYRIRVYRIPAFVGAFLVVLALAACQPVQPVTMNAQVPETAVAESAPAAPQADLPPAPDLTPDECQDLLANITDFVRADDYAAVVSLLDFVMDCGVPDELTAGILFLRAESNMKQGEWQVAVDDYRDALAFGLEAADAAGARNNICWFLALDDQAEAALPYCELAVSAAPVASYLDSRALAYALVGEYEKAIADFEAAVDEWADSENPQIQAIRAEREEWIETLRAGENPITPQVLAKLQSEDAPALRADLVSTAGAAATEHLLRGRQHHIYGQFDQALDEYTQAIDLDTSYALAHFYRGLIHASNSEWEDALADMQRVTLLEPNQAHAHHVAGLMYMRQEEYVEAVAAFSEAIDLLPDQVDFYADRAAAFFSIGEVESALADLDTTLRYNADAPQILFMRGAVHRALNNRGAAIADFERALELGLPFELAEQARQALRELREGFF